MQMTGDEGLRFNLYPSTIIDDSFGGSLRNYSRSSSRS